MPLLGLVFDSQKRKERKGGLNMGLYIMGTMLILISCIGGVYFIIQDKKREKQEN
jgi:glucose uptake protein GlcU